MPALYLTAENQRWLLDFCTDVFKKQDFTRLTPQALQEFEQRLQALIGAVTPATVKQIRNTLFTLPRAIKGRAHAIKRARNVPHIGKHAHNNLAKINDAIFDAQLVLIPQAPKRIAHMTLGRRNDSGISATHRARVVQDLRKDLRTLVKDEPAIALALYYDYHLHRDIGVRLTRNQEASLIARGLKKFAGLSREKTSLQWRIMENGVPDSVADMFYGTLCQDILLLSQHTERTEKEEVVLKDSIYKMMSLSRADRKPALQAQYGHTLLSIFANEAFAEKHADLYARALLDTSMRYRPEGAVLLRRLLGYASHGEYPASRAQKLITYLADPTNPVFPKKKSGTLSGTLNEAASTYPMLAVYAFETMAFAFREQLKLTADGKIKNAMEVLDGIDTLLRSTADCPELAAVTPWPVFAQFLHDPVLKPGLIAQAEDDHINQRCMAEIAQMPVESENARAVATAAIDAVYNRMPKRVTRNRPVPSSGTPVLRR